MTVIETEELTGGKNQWGVVRKKVAWKGAYDSERVGMGEKRGF